MTPSRVKTALCVAWTSVWIDFEVSMVRPLAVSSCTQSATMRQVGSSGKYSSGCSFSGASDVVSVRDDTPFREIARVLALHGVDPAAVAAERRRWPRCASPRRTTGAWSG